MAILQSFIVTQTKSNQMRESNRSDEGLTLETSAFKLFSVANLRYQLSWLYYITLLYSPTNAVTVSLETNPVYLTKTS